MNKRLTVCASHVLLAQESNRRYMTLFMRMFSTRRNLNGVAVTEGFIDKIITNAQDYVSMPLCADVKSIERGEQGQLGHMYDERTGLFEAQEIGSFVSFSKEIDDDGAVALNGVARVNKRNPWVIKAIREMYATGSLNFSFEIEAGTVDELPDGTLLIDAADDNDLMAMAVVTTPAYPEATALNLVASAEGSTPERGETMEKDVVLNPEVAEVETSEQPVDAAESQEAERHEDECAATEVAEREENPESNNGNNGGDIGIQTIDEIINDAGGNAGGDAGGNAGNDQPKDGTEEGVSDVPAELIVEPEERHEDELRDEERELRDELNEARRELEELRRYRDEIERREREEREERERREREERMGVLREFVDLAGFNAEDAQIASAIEELNYEPLVAEYVKTHKEVKPETVISSRIESTMTLAGHNSMFDRVK